MNWAFLQGIAAEKGLVFKVMGMIVDYSAEY
jgi:hypothetical protein